MVKSFFSIVDYGNTLEHTWYGIRFDIDVNASMLQSFPPGSHNLNVLMHFSFHRESRGLLGSDHEQTLLVPVNVAHPDSPDHPDHPDNPNNPNTKQRRHFWFRMLIFFIVLLMVAFVTYRCCRPAPVAEGTRSERTRSQVQSEFEMRARHIWSRRTTHQSSKKIAEQRLRDIIVIMSCQSCHICRKCIWRESYLLSTICLPRVHAALWVLTRESRRTWWHMTPNSRHLGEQYAATGAVKDVAGVKTTWIKCIRIPRFVGSSSWSSLGKKWKRNTWRLFLSPKFAQTSETSDLARRIGAVAMLPTHAKQMAAHIELVEEYFWAVSSWMSCISGSMCRVFWVFSFVTVTCVFFPSICAFANSPDHRRTLRPAVRSTIWRRKPKKNDSLWRNFMYHIGIITRRHSILGDSPNKNREDLILVGFYVGGLFYSEVVKISKVLE